MDVVGKVACAAIGIALCILGEASAVTQSAAQPSGSTVANTLQRPPDIAFVQTPKFSAGNPAGRFPLGSRLVRLRFGAGGTAPSAVTPLIATVLRCRRPPGLFRRRQTPLRRPDPTQRCLANMGDAGRRRNSTTRHSLHRRLCPARVPAGRRNRLHVAARHEPFKYVGGASLPQRWV